MLNLPSSPVSSVRGENGEISSCPWWKLYFVTELHSEWDQPQNDHLLSSSHFLLEQSNTEGFVQAFLREKDKMRSPPQEKKNPPPSVPFFLSSTRNYLKIIVMSLSQPEHLEDMFNIQLGPAHCFSSEGGSPCPGVQSPLHTHKHKCITPQCCCPLSLPALPVGKAKPGSCQFQLRLGHVALLKKACW